MPDKRVAAQAGRFLLVGVSNTILSYVLFLFLYYSLLKGMTFWSQCISYAAGIIWSFAWNRKWTFSGVGNWKKQFPRFLIVQTLLLLISAFVLTAASRYFSWNINLLWAATMAFVTILNFILTKFLVFEGDVPQDSEAEPASPRKPA